VQEPEGVIIEIDGRRVTDPRRDPGHAPYGHFTAMQVRGRSTRGLELHLERLDTANRELFGSGNDRDEVLARIGHALGDVQDASLRVYMVEHEQGEGTSTVVTVRPPGSMPAAPQRLEAVPYLRTLAHVKHLGDFGQTHHRHLAHRHGCDDALLTGPEGAIAECGIANIAFVDAAGVVWPDAPALAGITMQLLEPRLGAAGLPSRRATVRLADLPAYRGAFVTNARGIAPVGQIDDVELAVDGELMQAVAAVYASVLWDPIADR
jgi:branched-subunit amino acid aminotransferase/4-amino-4-deoxychorismate lyase